MPQILTKYDVILEILLLAFALFTLNSYGHTESHQSHCESNSSSISLPYQNGSADNNHCVLSVSCQVPVYVLGMKLLTHTSILLELGSLPEKQLAKTFSIEPDLRPPV